MSILQGLTRVFQGFQEWKSKDEIIFGEIVRFMVTQGHPVIGFQAEAGYQSARFLIQNEVLFSLQISLDKKLGPASVLNLVAEVRNKLSDPDDMIEMFKTDFGNLAKIPLFGQIKINHEYNTIFASTSSVKSLNTYLGEQVGEVKGELLRTDLEEMMTRLTEALTPYKKS
jgi:hypothetical protein